MKRVLIVGGGPAGLMAAWQLMQSGKFQITLFDQKPTVGRKFLVAGEGGFNLTHSETLIDFIAKYDSDRLKNAVSVYTNTDFIQFLENLGIPMRIGSSGKIFPAEGIKPIEVLNVWKKVLSPEVQFLQNWKLVDFDAENLVFEDKSGSFFKEKYDFAVFALGGASWSKTGSDGKWKNLFESKGIEVNPFVSSNSGLNLFEEWKTYEPGEIWKNVRVSVGNIIVAGDVVLTNYGLEGKPIYAVNRNLRTKKELEILVDFKPQLDMEQVAAKIRASKNTATGLKLLKIPLSVRQWLLCFTDKSTYQNPELLAGQLKSFVIPVSGFRPLEEVISTAGGVSEESLNPNGSLKSFPKIFPAGEMLDWDAPTGGYLIQGCVATAYSAAKAIIDQFEVD